MNTFKTELFKVSFDQNDIKKIVHITSIKYGATDSFLVLSHVLTYVTASIESGTLSKKEAVKIITKASEWML